MVQEEPLITKNVDASKLYKAMDHWPATWKGMDADIATGRKIVEVIRPFLGALVAHGQARSTINRHLNNLWLLGGEIITRIHHDAALRRKRGRDLLLAFVDDEGGPLCRHIHTEADQRAFDSTCRKLARYLVAKTQTKIERHLASQVKARLPKQSGSG